MPYYVLPEDAFDHDSGPSDPGPPLTVPPGYVDLNLTASLGVLPVGFTVGYFFSPRGANLYVGGGLMTPGASFSVMVSPQTVSPGAFSGQFSVAGGPVPVGVQGAMSVGGDTTGGAFQEYGFALGTPGASLIGAYTFP
jgi:hypothetical protein